MKKLVLILVALSSISAFSATDYCTAMEYAKIAGYDEIARLTQLASEQTDQEEIDKITNKIEKVEAVNFKINEACSQG